MKAYTISIDQNGRIKSHNSFLLSDKAYENGFERSQEENLTLIPNSSNFVYITSISIKEQNELVTPPAPELSNMYCPFNAETSTKVYSSCSGKGMSDSVVVRICFNEEELQKCLETLTQNLSSYSVQISEYRSNTYYISGVTKKGIGIKRIKEIIEEKIR